PSPKAKRLTILDCLLSSFHAGPQRAFLLGRFVSASSSPTESRRPVFDRVAVAKYSRLPPRTRRCAPAAGEELRRYGSCPDWRSSLPTGLVRRPCCYWTGPRSRASVRANAVALGRTKRPF